MMSFGYDEAGAGKGTAARLFFRRGFRRAINSSINFGKGCFFFFFYTKRGNSFFFSGIGGKTAHFGEEKEG